MNFVPLIWKKKYKDKRDSTLEEEKGLLLELYSYRVIIRYMTIHNIHCKKCGHFKNSLQCSNT